MAESQTGLNAASSFRLSSRRSRSEFSTTYPGIVPSLTPTLDVGFGRSSLCWMQFWHGELEMCVLIFMSDCLMRNFAYAEIRWTVLFPSPMFLGTLIWCVREFLNQLVKFMIAHRHQCGWYLPRYLGGTYICRHGVSEKLFSLVGLCWAECYIH